MAGNKIGGAKAAKTNKEKWGEDFYSRIGAIGGRKGTTGGFAHPTPCICSVFPYDHTVARCAGSKGGKNSRRPRKAER